MDSHVFQNLIVIDEKDKKLRLLCFTGRILKWNEEKSLNQMIDMNFINYPRQM
jgi:hypothetical protein